VVVVVVCCVVETKEERERHEKTKRERSFLEFEKGVEMCHLYLIKNYGKDETDQVVIFFSSSGGFHFPVSKHRPRSSFFVMNDC